MPPDQDLAAPAAEVEKPAATDAPAGDAGSTISKPAADSSSAEGDGKPASSTGADGSDGGKAPGTALEAMFAARKKISEEAAKVADAKPGEKSPDSKEAGKPEGDLPAAKAEDAKADEAQPGDKKKDAPARVKELLAERAELAPRAESFDQLQNWVKEKGLSQEDFAGALEITALTKSDPHAALARLKPIYEALQKAAGDILPDDLAAKVESGSLDEVSARELAQARSKATIAEANQKRNTEEEQHRRESAAADAQVMEIATAVSAWEADWKKIDPDYPHKAPFVITEIKAMCAAGDIPANKEAALVQAKKAREIVEARLKQMLPAPAQKTVVTGGSNSGTTLPVPKSSIDAMRAAQHSV